MVKLGQTIYENSFWGPKLGFCVGSQIWAFILAPSWPNLVPFGPQLGGFILAQLDSYWPIVGSSWPKLVPSWPNLGLFLAIMAWFLGKPSPPQFLDVFVALILAQLGPLLASS